MISAIRPKVTQGQKQVMQPASYMQQIHLISSDDAIQVVFKLMDDD